MAAEAGEAPPVIVEASVVEAPVVDNATTADATFVPMEVKTEGRKVVDKSFSILFALAVGFWVILAIVIFAEAKAAYKTKKGIIEGIMDHYVDDMETCCSSLGLDYSNSMNCVILATYNDWSYSGRRLSDEDHAELLRRLGDSDKNTPTTIWEGFGNEPVIPIVMVIAAIALCVGFIWAMEKCSYQILMGTFFLEWCGCMYIAINPHGDGIIWPFFFPCVFIMLWVGLMHKKIEEAAGVISLAAHALLAMPSLMCFVYSWLIVSGLLVFIYILVLSASGQVLEVNSSTCEFKQKDYVSSTAFLVNAIWGWMWFYASAVQIFFVAGCVGTYHFDKSKAVATLPVTMIKIAVTTSAGCLAKLALVFQAVDYIRRKSRLTCRQLCCAWWDPTVWIACLIRCCCLSFLNMMTKFCLIFHSFTGEDFWTSAVRCMDLLKNAGLSGLVLETAALNTFIVIRYFVSAGIGMACWAWMDDIYGLNILKDGGFLFWFMMGLFFLFIYMPVYAIALVILIALLVADNIWNVWIPWFCGLFIGGITSFFFDQTTQALLYASNTMFVAIAIQKTHGKINAESPFAKKMVAIIAEARIVGEDGNEVKNTFDQDPNVRSVVETAEPAPVV